LNNLVEEDGLNCMEAPSWLWTNANSSKSPHSPIWEYRSC